MDGCRKKKKLWPEAEQNHNWNTLILVQVFFLMLFFPLSYSLILLKLKLSIYFPSLSPYKLHSPPKPHLFHLLGVTSLTRFSCCERGAWPPASVDQVHRPVSWPEFTPVQASWSQPFLPWRARTVHPLWPQCLTQHHKHKDQNHCKPKVSFGNFRYNLNTRFPLRK